MEKEIEKVAEEIAGGISSLEDRSILTQQAIRIAEIALTSFRGELLNKALNISKAITEYECELLQQG